MKIYLLMVFSIPYVIASGHWEGDFSVGFFSSWLGNVLEPIKVPYMLIHIMLFISIIKSKSNLILDFLFLNYSIFLGLIIFFNIIEYAFGGNNLYTIIENDLSSLYIINRYVFIIMTPYLIKHVLESELIIIKKPPYRHLLSYFSFLLLILLVIINFLSIMEWSIDINFFENKNMNEEEVYHRVMSYYSYKINKLLFPVILIIFGILIIFKVFSCNFNNIKEVVNFNFIVIMVFFVIGFSFIYPLKIWDFKDIISNIWWALLPYIITTFIINARKSRSKLTS